MVFELIRQNLSLPILIAILLAYVLVLIIAFSVHEFSHGFAAYLHGDYTAKAMGRLTLNPFKHIDPIGLACLLLMGFGWAKPVPYNPTNLRDGKRGMFAVAIAGIVSNIVLAFVFSMIQVVLFKFAPQVFLTTSFGAILLIYFLDFGVKINLYLAVFNLLPLFPLDGSKVLELILKPGNKFLEFLRKYSLIILIIMLVTTAMSFVVFGLSDLIMKLFFRIWSFIFRLR